MQRDSSTAQKATGCRMPLCVGLSVVAPPFQRPPWGVCMPDGGDERAIPRSQRRVAPKPSSGSWGEFRICDTRANECDLEQVLPALGPGLLTVNERAGVLHSVFHSATVS